jgi:hypothetical protein
MKKIELAAPATILDVLDKSGPARSVMIRLPRD